MTTAAPLEIQTWPIDRLVLYARNPRKKRRRCGSPFTGIKASEGQVEILWDEWSPAQVKVFRLMVIRSVNWASSDDELLALELRN